MTRRRLSLRRGLLGAALAGVVAGCMPVIAHGPEVRSGISEAISVGAGARWPWRSGLGDGWRDSTKWQAAPTVSLEPALRYGSARTSPRGTAVQGSLSVRVPAMVLSETGNAAPAGDLYLQLPDGPRLLRQRGIGFSASVGHLMPYVMAGGHGWYTTQALALMTWPNARQLMWLPGLAVVETHQHSALHTRLQLGVPLHWYDGTPHMDGGPRLVIAGGFLLEWFDR